MKQINAMYSGTCEVCKESIEVGSPIMYEYRPNRPYIAHVFCHDTAQGFDSSETLPEVAVQNEKLESYNLYEHPVVAVLLSKIGELEEQINNFKENSTAIKLQIKSHTDVIDDIKKRYEAEIDEHSKEIRELRAQGSGINSGLRLLVDTVNQLKNEMNDSIEGLAASRQLQAVQEKWNNVLAEAPFMDAIRPFQRQGAIFLAEGRRVLLADKMGLGKTIQTIAALYMTDQEFQDDPSVLWVTTKNNKRGAQREIIKWNPSRPTLILEGNATERAAKVMLAQQVGMTLICNYEALWSTPSIVSDYSWPRVVLDEADKFRNDETKLFSQVEKLCADATNVYELTGTPINNKPEDFWALLHMLDPRRFDNKKRFMDRYAWGDQYSYGSYNDLIKQVKSIVLSRTKEDVKIQLPAKTHEERSLDWGYEEEATLYKQMKEEFAIFVDSEGSDSITAFNILPWFTRLMQLTVYPAAIKQASKKQDEDGEFVDHVKQVRFKQSTKLDEAQSIIDELASNNDKCIVYCTFNDPLKELQARLGLDVCKLITGETSDSETDAVTKQLNDPNSPVKVVCLNVRAGRGLNLQESCSHAIFLNRWWNPAVNEQAEDRLHRIGQTNPVTIHDLVIEGTIDQFIAAKLAAKQDLSSSIFSREELKNAMKEGLI